MIREFSFNIAGRLPGLNDIIFAARSNRYGSAIQKKRAQRICEEHISISRVPYFVNPVDIAITWVEPNARRDIDNVTAGTKYVLDALVSTGRLQNDSRKFVRSISHTFPAPDKKNPHIKVTIWERGEG